MVHIRHHERCIKRPTGEKAFIDMRGNIRCRYSALFTVFHKLCRQNGELPALNKRNMFEFCVSAKKRKNFFCYALDFP